MLTLRRRPGMSRPPAVGLRGSHARGIARTLPGRWLPANLVGKENGRIVSVSKCGRPGVCAYSGTLGVAGFKF